MNLFTYDDVYLVPQYSELSSRSMADTSAEFLGRRFKVPIVPANMLDVINVDIAEYLAKNGYFYIMHRFDDDGTAIKISNFIERARELSFPYISISVGVNDAFKTMLAFADFSNIDYVTIDVAHSHHKNVKDMISFLGRYKSKKTKIIAGNVTTADGCKFLEGLGVDAIKIGIGGGSICSTRYETGFHLPVASSIVECSRAVNIPIIADGGIKYHGDIAKALALGASFIMAGGLFAKCLDSPAKIINGQKVYRGSTSYDIKKSHDHVEGVTLQLEQGITYAEELWLIEKALRSSISYAGGKDLSALARVEKRIKIPIISYYSGTNKEYCRPLFPPNTLVKEPSFRLVS